MGLSILTGAPGSGKTALTPGLREALPGVVVLDLDEFLEAGSRLAGRDLASGSAAELWPAYEDLCLELVAAVLAAGHDVLLLCPLDPPQVRRTDLGPIRWAVLDCSNATRADRLSRRSPVDGLVEGALADAAELRALGKPILRNDGIAVDQAVALVADWVGRSA